MSLQSPLLIVTTFPSAFHPHWLPCCWPIRPRICFCVCCSFPGSLSPQIWVAPLLSRSLPYEPSFYCFSSRYLNTCEYFPVLLWQYYSLLLATQIFVYPTTSVTEYVMKDSGWSLISSMESRLAGGLHPVVFKTHG